jgi:hypothetical protein
MICQLIRIITHPMSRRIVECEISFSFRTLKEYNNASIGKRTVVSFVKRASVKKRIWTINHFKEDVEMNLLYAIKHERIKTARSVSFLPGIQAIA